MIPKRDKRVIIGTIAWFRERGGHALGWLKSRVVEGAAWMAYVGWLPTFLERVALASIWNAASADIYARYGQNHHDFDVLTDIITRFHIDSVLDAGCGSGRLFALYASLGLTDVIGVDLSEETTARARIRFPSFEVRCQRLEELSFSANRFNLVVSNRVLQHIPVANIEPVISKLCQCTSLVYINEMFEGDGSQKTWFMQAHDYSSLFRRYGFELVERGRIGNGYWLLFSSQTGGEVHG